MHGRSNGMPAHSTLRPMVPDLLTAPTTSPLSLYRYRDGLYAADLLTAAIVEFDFFTWLDAHPSTLAGRVRQVRLPPAAGRRDADAVRGAWLRRARRRRVPRLRCRPRAPHGRSPWYLAPYFGALKERPFVQDFARVLRTGQPANWGGARSGQDWHVAMQDEAFARRFTAAMDCRGLYLGEALARAVDLSTHRRVLDIGGGSGIYACALAARHPHLRGDRARPGARRTDRDHAHRRARPCRPHRRRRRRLLQPSRCRPATTCTCSRMSCTTGTRPRSATCCRPRSRALRRAGSS